MNHSIPVFLGGWGTISGGGINGSSEKARVPEVPWIASKGTDLGSDAWDPPWKPHASLLGMINLSVIPSHQMEELEHAANPRDEHCLNRVWKYVVIFTLPIHVDFYRPFWFQVWFSKKILISSLLEGLLTKTKTRVIRWIKPHNAAHQYSLCDLQLWLREDQRFGQWTEEVKIK